MRARVAAAVALGLTAVTAAVATAGPAAPGVATRPHLIDTWRARADVPAVVVTLDDGSGSPWIGTSGSTDGTDSVFRAASITKTFVAVVVMQLADKGALALDDVAYKYVPRPLARGVTVEQLLNHTSGLPDYSVVDGFGRGLLEDRRRRWSADDVLDLVEGLERDFAPGTDYRYSNTNYVLLGEVIADVTGNSWATEVRDRILEPLGMEDTVVAGVEKAPRAPLPGYFDADNDGDRENIENGAPWTSLETSEGPAGALLTTAADLVTFGDELFRGRLVSRASLDTMTTEGPFPTRTSGYGLGVEVSRPDYQTTAWGHGGFLPGFRSLLWYVPSRDLVIVVLANDSTANVADLAELLLSTSPPRRSP